MTLNKVIDTTSTSEPKLLQFRNPKDMAILNKINKILKKKNNNNNNNNNNDKIFKIL